MKKRMTFVLALVLTLVLVSCSRPVADGAEQELSQESQQAFDLEELRQKFPEYFDLRTSKGLEVYVWQIAEDSYRCGVLPGTNREKTSEEMWKLWTNSAAPEEMKAILASYEISDDYILIASCIQPYSSYYYEIDEAYTQKVTALFKASADAVE